MITAAVLATLATPAIAEENWINRDCNKYGSICCAIERRIGLIDPSNKGSVSQSLCPISGIGGGLHGPVAPYFYGEHIRTFLRYGTQPCHQ